MGDWRWRGTVREKLSSSSFIDPCACESLEICLPGMNPPSSCRAVLCIVFCEGVAVVARDVVEDVGYVVHFKAWYRGK